MPTTVTHTLKASGGDYTTPSAWEAAQQRDLVALDEIAVLECYNDWPTGLVGELVVGGWTSSPTNYVEITTPASERHTGKKGTGFLLKLPANWTGYTFNGSCVVDGLEFDSNGKAASVLVNLIAGSGHYGVIKNSIANGVASNSPTVLFNYPRYSTNSIVGFNNLATGSNSGKAVGFTNWSSKEIANHTVIGDGTGVAFAAGAGDDSAVKNCVAYNVTTSFDEGAYVFHATNSTNNAAWDGSTVTPPGASPLTVDIISSDFEDVANDDCHLSASSQLIGQGADLSATFTTDIDGEIRSVPWDIGLDQIVSAITAIDNNLVSAMHFQKLWEPIAMGE